jgi:hypothetical protein
MDADSIRRAELLLRELTEDREAAPHEFRGVPDLYLKALLESLEQCRAGRLPGRELEAHCFQIRLSYARDLQRLLPSDPPPTARWVRSRVS